MIAMGMGDWERMCVKRIARKGLAGVAEDVTGGRRIAVATLAGDRCFDLALLRRDGCLVAAVLRGDDEELAGLPHRTGAKGSLEAVGERILVLQEGDHGADGRIFRLLDAEIDRVDPSMRQSYPMVSEPVAALAERLVDLVAAGPARATATIASILAALPPETVGLLAEGLDRKPA